MLLTYTYVNTNYYHNKYTYFNMMKKCCCISLTLAARFVGAFDLSTSILAINFITKDFFSDEQRLRAFDVIQIFLGLSWTNRSTDSQPKQNYEFILGCLMVYSIVHLVCSANLILATIFRKKAYATPWLIFEIISLASQAGGLAANIFLHQDSGETATAGPAYVPIASFYLLLGTYFWLVVFTAQKSWPMKTAEVYSDVKEVNHVQLHAVNLDLQKTPSRNLEVDHSIFESPEPPIPSKYYQL